MAKNKHGVDVTRPAGEANLYERDERERAAQVKLNAQVAVAEEANSPEARAAEAMRMQALEEAHGDPVLQGELLARLQAESGGVDQEAELRGRLAEDDGYPEHGYIEEQEDGQRAFVVPSLSDELAAAAGDVLEPEGYARMGECVFRWALIPVEDEASDDLQLLFQVQVDGHEDAGLIQIDITQARMASWRKGLQTSGGERQFAAGLMERLLEVATARMADNLRLCLEEVTHGPLAQGGHKDEASAYEAWHMQAGESDDDA